MRTKNKKFDIEKKQQPVLKTDKNRLLKFVEKFTDQKIVVLGDLMLDRYLWSTVERISPEAPVPIAKVEKETFVPGGAANTVFNLASLGVKVKPVGLVGDDVAGKQLTKIMSDRGIGLWSLVVDSSYSTTVKSRIMSGTHQMIRFDYEKSMDIAKELESRILSNVNDCLNDASILVISDYSKGLISTNLARKVVALAKQKKVKVLVDPTPKSFLKYKNSYLIKPNKKEAEEILGDSIASDYSNIESFGKRIIKKLNTEVAFITLGKDGIVVIDSHDGIFQVPTASREVYDVSGAGDTTMATLAASLACRATLKEAAILANLSAGIVVGKLGTAVCTQQELKDRLKEGL